MVPEVVDGDCEEGEVAEGGRAEGEFARQNQVKDDLLERIFATGGALKKREELNVGLRIAGFGTHKKAREELEKKEGSKGIPVTGKLDFRAERQQN
jgi:hypothetical protein